MVIQSGVPVSEARNLYEFTIALAHVHAHRIRTVDEELHHRRVTFMGTVPAHLPVRRHCARGPHLVVVARRQHELVEVIAETHSTGVV